jgi:hypothetical protein
MANFISPSDFEPLRQRAHRARRDMLDRVAESLDRIAISEELLRRPIYQPHPLNPNSDPTVLPDRNPGAPH